ncbi:hypothetical protein GLW03_11130 [Halobacillus halophilus]|uniref:hypothetical protein n=1 Tax=Halobacillus halophilus TaxID=1570 RepID=UPI001369D599|nr:hypothetical protein [Halobacillus halophilus]MYL30375.1 hypothetical protein [Halobacillus halophilus]
MENYSVLYLKQENRFRSQSKHYRLASNEKIVGIIEEDLSSSRDKINMLLKSLSLYAFTGVNLNLMTKKNKLIGELIKTRGFSNTYTYKSFNEEIYSIEAKAGLKNPKTSITIYKDHEEIIKGTGNFSGYSFDFLDNNEKLLMRVKKTTIPSSLKNFFDSLDVFKLDIKDPSSEYYNLFIALGLIIDLNFHE